MGVGTWPLHFSSFLLSFVVSIAFLVHMPLWSDDDSDVMLFLFCLFIPLEEESLEDRSGNAKGGKE